MNYNFYVGFLGSLILVTGAAWPESKVQKSIQLTKNWLFAIGNAIMMIYSLLGYIEGGSIFFVFLQALVGMATILMMLDMGDRINTPILSLGTLLLIIWSLYLFQGYTTIFFVLGLSAVSFGYAFKMRTLHRDIALIVGSLLIALFSYIEKNWIFFGLNLFFALFSSYYLAKKLTGPQSAPQKHHP